MLSIAICDDEEYFRITEKQLILKYMAGKNCECMIDMSFFSVVRKYSSSSHIAIDNITFTSSDTDFPVATQGVYTASLPCMEKCTEFHTF